MTSIPPSTASPSTGPSQLGAGGSAASVTPAGGKPAVADQLSSGSAPPDQGNFGNAGSTDAQDVPPAATIASSVEDGPVIVATVIGPAQTDPAAGTGAAGGPGPLAPAPAGTQVSLRFAGVLTDVGAAAASAASGQLVGTVIGRTPAGQLIVDTAAGRLAIAAAITEDAAAASQIAFDIIAIVGRTAAPAAMAGAASPTVGRRGLSGLAREWPTLQAALDAVAKVNPALARQIVDIMLPRPDGPRFVMQVLSFLASPRDDVAALLGREAADALQTAGRSDLAQQIEGDLRDLNRLNAAAAGWQMFFVPVVERKEVRQLRVFTRRRKDGKDEARGSGRFVVEVEFESVGPLQLDGLVNKPRLDLILRSHVDLSPSLQAGIAGVFGQTCDAAGLVGKIFFQTLPAFPVAPLDEMARQHGPGLSV